MLTQSIDGLTIHFDPQENDTADLVAKACVKSVPLIQECWGLNVPAECHVYVMTSWLQYAFRSAPWHWRILMGITLPLWGFRARKTWRYGGGLAQRYGKRHTIGIKPPRLIEAGDKTIGERIFIPETDMGAKVGQMTCHELTHAFTAHLKLPAWLNEGLAMVAVDKYAEKPTVQPETVGLLAHSTHQEGLDKYQDISFDDKDAIVYQVVRGYWITRYCEDTQPGLLKSLLAKVEPREKLEDTLAVALDMSREAFWQDIDSVVANHFSRHSG